MDEGNSNSPCKECNNDVDGALHAEVEHVRQHLAERDAHIVVLEGEYIKCSSRANELEEQIDTWREKYERLYDSHKRVQKLNQVLEDKLLQMVDKMKSEKSQLTKDIATLSVRLAESKHNYSMLQKENERYKNDMNLAIQLLQCKPDNFVSHKLDNLPVDTQARVSQYVMSKTAKPAASSTVSKNGNENDTFDASEYEFNISASLMSKILEDSIHDTMTKHCDTCSCMKSQNKPFCYNESYYTVATQTKISGEMKNSFCLNCNLEIKSINSAALSIRSSSPHGIKLVNEKNINHVTAPMYIIPQPISEHPKSNTEPLSDKVLDYESNTHLTAEVNDKVELNVIKDNVPKLGEDIKQLKRNNSMSMEPAVHHKLCDRTKTSVSSKKSSIHSVGNDETLIKDVQKTKEYKPKIDDISGDSIIVRKNSQSSMGAMSRTSSVAKSTVSTHKSNTQVGPGPRFCHLRMQAGSKNILLDNAEPDVPPVLYRRQSKCTQNSIFKDLNDGMDNFIDLEKADDDNAKNDVKNDNVVVETTLIDVHVDNNNRESSTTTKITSINPILLNVSSSPLQPLKTHTFSNGSEHNNNNSQSIGSQQNPSDVNNLFHDFNNGDVSTKHYNSKNSEENENHGDITPADSHDVKIFNFDRYEQSKLACQYPRSLRMIDMSQLHSIENTKISKDFPPQGELPKIEKNVETTTKTNLPAIVNVYPNLTQTHLKVNEHKKVFTNEQSTSSLSSDDSAALLQKQQLLRVAEWVEKNLEQQNNFNDPLDEDVNFNNKTMRRDSKLCRLTETLNELALNMPLSVSKYSKSFSRDKRNAWVHNNFQTSQDKAKQSSSDVKMIHNVVKETIFPVESEGATITEINTDTKMSDRAKEYEVVKDLREAFTSNGDKEITPEELARMEYNVKKFLLSGPHWVNPASVSRSRRTSSKTETDV